MKGLPFFNATALLSCAAFFALSVGCSSDDDTVTPKGDSGATAPVKVDTTTYVDPNTGETVVKVDTAQQSIEAITTIDENGDSVIVYDTVYVSQDTTLHWVGNSALRITEILPVNLDWLDEDGDDGSWVEIYNAGDKSANLKGYSLIENTKAVKKWVFGDEVVPAKKFRIVFCDKKDISDAASSDTELGHSRTHTNWKMEKDGGTVYLVDRNYGIRDSVQFPELEPGVSWGITDGGAWKYFAKPTPEAKNSDAIAYDGMAPVVDLSQLKSGFYNDAITLNPPTLESGVTLRCTQNGSAPTKDSQEFNSQITIDHNTVLRCAAFKEGTITKSVVTKTFFIGESVNMPVVSVSVDPVFFEKYYKKTNGGEPDMKHDQMYAPNESYPDDSGELPAHVEFFDKGSSSQGSAWEIDAGISLMGGWSRMERKKSLAVVMREEYETGWLKYPLFQPRDDVNNKFKGFNLRNNGNRFVADYFADAVGGAILEGSSVDYQRSRQVVVFYNGTYYGIHDMRERYNKNYVETNYGIDASSVNFIKHLNKTVTASNGTTADYLAMLAFISGNDMTNPDNYNTAKSMIDIGNFADYMIAEMYIHNGDWPDNNVRAWRSPDQPWKFMIYDLDHGFEWDWNVSGFGESVNMFKWVKNGGKNGCNSGDHCFAALYNSLIKSDSFKRLFLNHASVMFANYLNGENVTNKAKFLASMLDASDVERDMAVEAYKGRRDSYGKFDPYGEKLGPWAVKRDAVVESEYASEFGVSNKVNVSIGASGNGSVLMEGMKLPGNGSYSGKFYAGIGMELTAVPAGGAVFAGWSDGSTDNPHVISTDSDVSITATFK